MTNLEKIPAEKLRQFVEQTIAAHAAAATDPAAPPKAWQKSAVFYFQCLRDIKVSFPPTRP